MIVLYHSAKQAFKGRPGITRGSTPLLEHAATFPIPQDAADSLAPDERDDWHVMRVNLERVPPDELLHR